jgi:co-chaperonin GroES (HSP10)
MLTSTTEARIPALSECDPGIRATGFSVVIAVPDNETVTKGGIIIPDTISERDKLSTTRGRLVSKSPVAFDYAAWPEGTSPPDVGNLVHFAKFAGIVIKGRDGREYRVCVDKDVWAIADEENSHAA